MITTHWLLSNSVVRQVFSFPVFSRMTGWWRGEGQEEDGRYKGANLKQTEEGVHTDNAVGMRKTTNTEVGRERISAVVCRMFGADSISDDVRARAMIL